MNNDFRFRLDPSPEGNRILDSQQPGRFWVPVAGETRDRPLEDYALAVRALDSRTGRALLLASGISTYGTLAAAEFLTDPRRMAELEARAPRPLDQGNFQALLHTRIMDNTPGPPKIIDVHFW